MLAVVWLMVVLLHPSTQQHRAHHTNPAQGQTGNHQDTESKNKSNGKPIGRRNKQEVIRKLKQGTKTNRKPRGHLHKTWLIRKPVITENRTGNNWDTETEKLANHKTLKQGTKTNKERTRTLKQWTGSTIRPGHWKRKLGQLRSHREQRIDSQEF